MKRKLMMVLMTVYWMQCTRPSIYNSITHAYMPEIHQAVEGNELQHVKKLLDQGNSIHETDTWGRTPLHLATNRDNITLVKLLLDHRADVNRPDKLFGKTPLHEAAEKGHVSIVNILLQEK